MKMVIIKILI
ncbi:hypothetical protein QN277_005646 [Acacia crassicarpa]|uniref:Uncharacterized protein n=1 Tax=Acacia crassicarpa TaxID=499986 RepID=A0AAE1IWR3_9FABA|nr:hypothetical protein QN277_005646 [Acacia crassicarpa]